VLNTASRQEWRGGLVMSQALKARKLNPKPSVVRGRQLQPSSREHHLERESRLRIAEAEARCQRWVRLISILVINFIVLGASTVWAIAFLGNYSTTDKQYMTGFIVQIVLNLLLFLAGKKFKWPS
jgi:hypothetical protein